MVILETNMGIITMSLFEDTTPITTKNFLNYVEENFYDGTIFHRVIDGFMIQGGGFDKNMQQKTTNDSIQNEATNGLSNKKYTVAMARTNAPHSASSQFFINVADNAFLDYSDKGGWGYCVFAKIVSGMEVVDNIEKVATKNVADHADVPNDAVVIMRAYIKN